MLFKQLVVLAAAALAVNAQTPTSSGDASVPSGLTTCIVDCSTQAAASAGCSSFSDLPCVCTSTTFQSAAGACLQANCTTAEVQTATQLQTAECASLSPNASSATSSSSATSPTTSHTSSSAKTSGTSAPTSGAATGLVPSLALNGAFGGLVALAGALIGAAFVL
ncbi:hypothetical protein K503DRAFT_785016 [Rhizopogon vinicolor AM-OR11-026]|uniref:CFEM domain-containing protein n=1 Tax=Rhizopogon vinicolor AM-OR11-026 TaxID=1314800 RepID=A0A1B7MSE2_9AGAM|nr:hypothetical protein K503DRAFT_785016 [Rhizopogon vinicolor AM-OR11-026]